MPTKALTVTTTEQQIAADAKRTVLIIQNVDVGADMLYVSDVKGNVANTGIILYAQGGSITLRKANGEEPQKEWTIIASAAGTPVRVMELYGQPYTSIEPIGNNNENPQEPRPQDPPRMRRLR